jgi:hypothetical protein
MFGTSNTRKADYKCGAFLSRRPFLFGATFGLVGAAFSGYGFAISDMAYMGTGFQNWYAAVGFVLLCVSFLFLAVAWAKHELASRSASDTSVG